MIERPGPDAPALITGESVSVVIAQAVSGGEVGVLLVFGSRRIAAPDALIFGADPDVTVRVPAKAGDKLPLCVRIPRQGVGKAGGRAGQQKREATNQRGRAGAASDASIGRTATKEKQ